MRNGSSYITKQEDLGGKITAANVTAQLLCELQGEMYLNLDVVADIRTVHITPTDEPRREVLVSGVKGHPPPLTTKVMVAAPGGYQAETKRLATTVRLWRWSSQTEQAGCHT